MPINDGGKSGGKTYSPFTGASSYANGSEGLVPQPTMGLQDTFLGADGNWKSIIQIKEYTESAWEVTPGTGVYDITMPGYGLYMLMIRGITATSALSYFATFYTAHMSYSSVGNVNYGSYGSLAFTALPYQILTGTDLSLENDASSRFIFGISNATSESIDVLYSYLRIL